MMNNRESAIVCKLFLRYQEENKQLKKILMTIRKLIDEQLGDVPTEAPRISDVIMNQIGGINENRDQK